MSDDALRERQKQVRARLNESDWRGLLALATKSLETWPHVAEFYGFAAHAARHLNQLERGYEFAKRGCEVDSSDLFVLNRLSLLANLTARPRDAYDAALANAKRAVQSEQDRFNLAVLLVNGIHAAAVLKRIDEAVEQFTPAIVALDHRELHFNSACLYALASDERALTYVRKALETDKGVASFADSDFDSLKDNLQFKQLLARDWAREKRALSKAKTTTRAELRPEHFVDLDALTAPGADENTDEGLDALDLTDARATLVYADSLLERGHPRGQLITLHQHWANATSENERMLACAEWARWFERHAATLAGPVATRQFNAVNDSVWLAGHVRQLRLEAAGRARTLDAAAAVRAMLRHASCRFLASLELREVRGSSYADIIAVLEDDCPVALASLSITPVGDFGEIELDVERLLRRCTQLERLELAGGHIELGPLELPRLRELVIKTTALSRRALDTILGAPRNALTSLELWFGAEDAGTDVQHASELGSLWAAVGLPTLTHLALKNAEITDEFVASLARSRLLPQLKSLDLSLGTLSDAGGQTLLASAPQFAHLERIDLSENALSAELVGDLERELPRSVCVNQKRNRYVSVSE